MIIAGLLVVTLAASTVNPRGKGDAERKRAPIDDFARAGRARCRRDRARCPIAAAMPTIGYGVRPAM
jgi:hypothetical protein